MLSSLRRSRPRAWFSIVGVLLPLIAGGVDGLGFVLLGFLSTHMSGNTAHLGMALGGRRWIDAESFGIGVLSFCVGAAVSAVLSEFSQRFSRGRYSAAFLLEAGTLTAATLAMLPRLALPVALPISLLCFAMGLQNGVTSRISGLVLRTTHMTGVLTDIGLMLGRAVIRVQRASDEPGSGTMHLAIYGSFLVGAGLGAVGGRFIGVWVAMVPASIILALAFIDAFSLLEPRPAARPV